MTKTKRMKPLTKVGFIPLSVLLACKRLSMLAQAVLLRCYALADKDGIVTGLLRGVGLAGLTKADVYYGLNELVEANVCVVRRADRSEYGPRLIVTLLAWCR